MSWGGGTQGFSQISVGPPLKLSWGDSSLAGMCRVAPILLQCVGSYSLVLAWVCTLALIGVNSVVVVCKLLSSRGVSFISISSRGSPIDV